MKLLNPPPNFIPIPERFFLKITPFPNGFKNKTKLLAAPGFNETLVQTFYRGLQGAVSKTQVATGPTEDTPQPPSQKDLGGGRWKVEGWSSDGVKSCCFKIWYVLYVQLVCFKKIQTLKGLFEEQIWCKSLCCFFASKRQVKTLIENLQLLHDTLTRHCQD